MRKKYIVYFLVVVLIFLAGCSKASEMDTVNNTELKKLVIGYGIDIEGLNTYNAIETKHNALSIVYDTLLKYENGDIKPNLAIDYEISDDGKIYTLSLREDVKFSDGTPFNAEAVKANFDILRKNEMFAWFGVISNIKEVKVVGENKVKLIYNMPYKPALQELCMYQPLSMVSPKIITEDNIVGTIGTGPYVLESYKKDSEYRFVRNEKYWGDKPLYDNIELKIITDPDARVMALKNGDIDMILGSDFITYDAFNQMKEDDNFTCKVADTVLKTRNLVLNSNSDILQDKKVRLAIEHAINKDEFVDSLLYGLEAKADSILHEDLPFCDIDIKSYEYEIDKSKALLEDAGWTLPDGKLIREKDGKPLKLSLIFPTDFIMNTNMAQAIKGYMREIGIDVELRGNEMMTWYSDCLEGNFDMCIENTYGLPYDPYNLLSIMLEGSSFSISQQNLVAKHEINKNIKTALFSNSDEKIQNAFKYVLTTVNEEAIYVPLSYQKDLVIFNNERIKDYTFGGLTEMIETKNIK